MSLSSLIILGAERPPGPYLLHCFRLVLTTIYHSYNFPSYHVRGTGIPKLTPRGKHVQDRGRLGGSGRR